MMDPITIVGLIAAAFTIIALLPQLRKVWKTKSTRDISTGMFTLYSNGLFLWFVYEFTSTICQSFSRIP